MSANFVGNTLTQSEAIDTYTPYDVTSSRPRKTTIEFFPTFRTTRININRININPNDYYNPVIDYYNQVIDYHNPVIDYYNPLLRFEPCLDQLGLILIRLILILILDPVIDYYNP